jgi:CelD/BcsL family acetyltransferase involved in cellulose biosynthesis
VVTSDFLDVIVPVGREEQVFSALLAGLRRDRSFHLVELTDLREGSLLRISGNPICHSGWCRREWTVEKICPSLPLPPDPAVYFSRLSRSVRKNFQYYRRRLENQGATLEIIREEEDLARALIDFSRLHGSRRRQKGQHGIFASEAQNAFYSDVLVRFFRAGWLELAFLNVAGVRVAGVCQFNYGDAVYYYQTGYDVSWEKSSVGFVLNGLLIERAILQGKSSYEFLRGAEEYKVRLGATHQSRLEDLYLLNGRLLGEMFVAYRRCSRAGRKVARELLDKALGSRMAGAKAGR